MVYYDDFYGMSLKVKCFYVILWGWIISSATFCDLSIGIVCLAGARVRVGLHVTSEHPDQDFKARLIPNS